MDLPQIPGLTRELAEGALLSRSFRSFIPHAWPVIETHPFVGGWHIDAIADHLQAVTKGEILKLAIMVPPGTSKSTCVSVMWPVYEWILDPSQRFLYQSWSQDLALDHALKSRNILRSDWFQARWPQVQIRDDQDQKTRYDTKAGGYRVSTTVGGQALGLHPTRIVWDDPNKRGSVDSAAECKFVNDEWDQTISTRGVGVGVRRVLVMQRLSETDAAGHILEREDDWIQLVLPMRYEPKRMVVTPLGFQDPRENPAETGVHPELLDPQRFPEHIVRAQEHTLGSYGTAGQLQQRPAPIGGGLIKRHHLRFWQPKGVDLGPVYDPETGEARLVVELPEFFDQEIQSWDMSFMDEQGQIRKGRPPDPVSGLVFGRLLASIYLLDRVNGVMDVMESARAVLSMTRRYPKTRVKLIENKANGAAVRAILRRMGVITQAVDPKGSKEGRVRHPERASTQREKDARAMSMQAMIEAGEFFLPHPKVYKDIWAFVSQLCTFPHVAHDDDVDATSQAFLYFERFIDRGLSDYGERLVEQPPPTTTEELLKRVMWESVDRENREAELAENQDFLDSPSSPWLN